MSLRFLSTQITATSLLRAYISDLVENIAVPAVKKYVMIFLSYKLVLSAAYVILLIILPRSVENCSAVES